MKADRGWGATATWVRLITRGGYNWTDRHPWIVEAALKNRLKQFVIDVEAVVLGVDGIADSNASYEFRSWTCAQVRVILGF